MTAYNKKYLPGGDMEYAVNRMATGHARVYKMEIDEIVGKENKEDVQNYG